MATKRRHFEDKETVSVDDEETISIGGEETLFARTRKMSQLRLGRSANTLIRKSQGVSFWEFFFRIQ